jgi:hypothetical protein
LLVIGVKELETAKSYEASATPRSGLIRKPEESGTIAPGVIESGVPSRFASNVRVGAG